VKKGQRWEGVKIKTRRQAFQGAPKGSWLTGGEKNNGGRRRIISQNRGRESPEGNVRRQKSRKWKGVFGGGGTKEAR